MLDQDKQTCPESNHHNLVRIASNNQVQTKGLYQVNEDEPIRDSSDDYADDVRKDEDE